MGLNQFSDLTDQELRKLYSGFKPLERNLVLKQNGLTKTRMLSIQPTTQPLLAPVPKPKKIYSQHERWFIDWRCLHKFPVYRLCECGACSFFAVVDALDISLRIRGYKPQSSSAQAAISCFAQSSKNICQNGANFIQIYDYVRKYGIGLADAYPYTDQMSPVHASQCNYQKLKSPSYRKKLLFIKQIYVIEENDCYQVVEQLKSRALTVAIIANSKFVKYESGTFDYDPQSNQAINHAVVLMGYDPDKGYLIKNEWGEGWGMKGYAYVRKESGVCQWAIYAKGFYQMDS